MKIVPAVAIGMVIAAIITSCTLLQGRSNACDAAAAEFGTNFAVAAHYEMSVREVTMAIPASKGLVGPSTDPNAPASVCYIDGDFPKAPPPDDSGVKPNYDRALVVVIGEASGIEALGYRATMQPIDPR